MSWDRRSVMIAGVGLAAAGPRPAVAQGNQPSSPLAEFGLRPDTTSDQTAALQRAIDAAAGKGASLNLPAGTYRVRRIELRSGLQLNGAAGRTVLELHGDDAGLVAKDGKAVRLDGLTVDGTAAQLRGIDALLALQNIEDLTIRDCHIVNSERSAIVLRGCSGRVTDCEIVGAAVTGLFSEDAKGLEIAHNHVHACANNGIQVWRSTLGEDGTLVANNRVERIKAQGGGSGQNGNGINLFRAGSVLVHGNRIADCAFTAIRANASSNCQMVANSCARLGEVALYAEFGFEGSLVANNLVDGAALGVSITNFNEGGRLAVVQGNLIRNLFLRKEGEARGIGIAVEADALVSGNVIENAPALGILLGWGKHLRDATASNNLIRKARIGIGVSATAGAGYAMIVNNMITGSTDGAIRAMNLDKPLGRDLVQSSTESFRNIAVHGNIAI